MARRNTRKKRKQKQRVNGFIFPVPFAGIVVVASALALGYVWLGCQCEALGDEIRLIESEGVELAKKHQMAEYRWVRTKSPRSMEIALERHGINMDWPRVGQIVRLNRAEAPHGVMDDVMAGGVRVAQLRQNMLHE